MSIILRNLVKRYGQQTIVDHVDLEITDGELFVLLGPSGSGKSTILRMIAGLTSATQGRIILHGRDVTDLPSQERDTGFVFQNYSLFRHMTVADNIEFGLAVRKVSAAERAHKRDELLDLVGLGGLGGRYPAQLSGGQQQRVAVARALASEPSVLLLDEPFGALDVQIRGQLRQGLKEIQRRLGVTTILVTHDQEEAFELADRIGIIDRGRLLGVGPPHQLYRRPEHEFVATFLGTANLLAGSREPAEVRLGPLALPSPDGATAETLNGRAEVLFRPEDLWVATDPSGFAGPTLGQGIVEETLFLGTLQRVRVRLEALPGTWPLPMRYGQEGIVLHVAMLSNADGAVEVSPGQTVWVGIKHYHVLPRRPFRLVVGLDETSMRGPVLPLAASLNTLGADMTVLVAAPTAARAEAVAADAHDALAAPAATDALPPQVVLRVGDLDDLLLAEAAVGEYDLGLVSGVGTNGSAERIAREALLPVLVAKGDVASLRRVLLCSAGGEPGKVDVVFGARLARRVHATATLLYVAPPSAAIPDATWLARYMEGGRMTLLGQGVGAQAKIRHGDVVGEILAEAHDGDYDLIVVGGHLPTPGRQAGQRDIASRILARADRPVLVVRGRLT